MRTLAAIFLFTTMAAARVDFWCGSFAAALHSAVNRHRTTPADNTRQGGSETHAGRYEDARGRYRSFR
jgi:hypothetical protein